MNKPDITTQWEGIIEFYDDLIGKYHWKQEPMLRLIEQLKERGFWRKYFPNTSHEALCLSLESDREVKYYKPMIHIRYRAKTNDFEICYQKGQGNTTFHKNCGREISPSEFKCIEDWLSDKKNDRPIMDIIIHTCYTYGMFIHCRLRALINRCLRTGR